MLKNRKIKCSNFCNNTLWVLFIDLKTSKIYIIGYSKIKKDQLNFNIIWTYIEHKIKIKMITFYLDR